MADLVLGWQQRKVNHDSGMNDLQPEKHDIDLYLALKKDCGLPLALKKLDYDSGMNDLQLEKHDIDLYLAFDLKKLELDHDSGMNDLQPEKHDIDLYLVLKKDCGLPLAVQNLELDHN
jgi:hypothetical protein